MPAPLKPAEDTSSGSTGHPLLRALEAKLARRRATHTLRSLTLVAPDPPGLGVRQARSSMQSAPCSPPSVAPTAGEKGEEEEEEEERILCFRCGEPMSQRGMEDSPFPELLHPGQPCSSAPAPRRARDHHPASILSQAAWEAQRLAWDFSSNDYLSLTLDHGLAERVHIAVQDYTTAHARVLGSSGSRLLSGNSREAEDLEAWLARAYAAPGGALLFPSGYMANLALLSCLAGPEDVVLHDAEIHASAHDGLRLSRAGHVSAFAHNDLRDLERQLRHADANAPPEGGAVLVVIESVYSMSGDLAPVQELASLLRRHPRACLIVDEAHATGARGWEGRGYLDELGLEGLPLVRVVTLGKGLGVEGGLLLFAHPVLRSYLLNYARPLIYSTAPALPTLLAIRAAHDHLRERIAIAAVGRQAPGTLPRANVRQVRLHQLIHLFRAELAANPLPAATAALLPSSTHIQGILVPGRARVRAVAAQLQAAGFDVRPIVQPTVPAGQERIRVCLHYHNSPHVVRALARRIACVLQQLQLQEQAKL